MPADVMPVRFCEAVVSLNVILGSVQMTHVQAV